MLNKDQGNIGEARAIFEFTRLGYIVSKPLSENQDYDLIVDNGSKLLKVQVKTSRVKLPSGNYEVRLTTSGGNRSWDKVIKKIDKDSVDMVFVMGMDYVCYLIPSTILHERSSVTLCDKYKEYKL